MAETLAEFASRLERVARAIPKEIRAVVETWAMEAEDIGKANATTLLSRRSGRLAASIRGRVEADGLGAVVQAGGRTAEGEVRYAAIHNRLRDTTILPKTGKFLAIPVGPAKTAAGVARYPSARMVPDLRYVQSLRGQPMLVKEKGRGQGKNAAKVEVWFLLRRSVTLRGVGYLTGAVAVATSNLRRRLKSGERLRNVLSVES